MALAQTMNLAKVPARRHQRVCPVAPTLSVQPARQVQAAAGLVISNGASAKVAAPAPASVTPAPVTAELAQQMLNRHATICK